MAVFGGMRGLAQAFIRAGVTRGLTASATINTLRAQGITYRRTAMLADYREWAQLPAKADVVKYIRHDYYPSKAMYVATVGKQRALYRYQVKVNIYKPELKEHYHIATNVVSDRQLTPSEVFDEAIPPIDSSVKGSNYDVVDYHLEGAFYREGEWD